jgi:hypothetical protein
VHCLLVDPFAVSRFFFYGGSYLPVQKWWQKWDQGYVF